MMWEAKTRYVLPYLFMQIPYMAMGMHSLVSSLEKWLEEKKQARLASEE